MTTRGEEIARRVRELSEAVAQNAAALLAAQNLGFIYAADDRERDAAEISELETELARAIDAGAGPPTVADFMQIWAEVFGQPPQLVGPPTFDGGPPSEPVTIRCPECKGRVPLCARCNGTGRVRL